MSSVPRKGQVWVVVRIIGSNLTYENAKVIREPDLKFVYDNGTVDMFENIICEFVEGESIGKKYAARISSFVELVSD